MPEYTEADLLTSPEDVLEGVIKLYELFRRDYLNLTVDAAHICNEMEPALRFLADSAERLFDA